MLQSAGTERHLLKSVRKRKMTYFGHIMRKKDKCQEKEIIQGTPPGGRPRGGPKTSWLGNIRLWRMAKNRTETWSNIVHAFMRALP